LLRIEFKRNIPLQVVEGVLTSPESLHSGGDARSGRIDSFDGCASVVGDQPDSRVLLVRIPALDPVMRFLCWVAKKALTIWIVPFKSAKTWNVPNWE